MCGRCEQFLLIQGLLKIQSNKKWFFKCAHGAMNKMNNNVHTFGDVRTVDQVFLSWSTTDEVCAGVVKPHDKVKSTQQLKICLSLYAWQWASYISRIWFMKYRPVLVSNLFLLPELDFCFVLLYIFFNIIFHIWNPLVLQYVLLFLDII